MLRFCEITLTAPPKRQRVTEPQSSESASTAFAAFTSSLVGTIAEQVGILGASVLGPGGPVAHHSGAIQKELAEGGPARGLLRHPPGQ